MRLSELIEKLQEIENTNAQIQVRDAYGEYTTEFKVTKLNGLEKVILLQAKG